MALSGVSIFASPKLNIVGMKFDRKLTFEDQVRGIVSRVSQIIGHLCAVSLYGLVSCLSLWTPRCCLVATIHLFSQSLSIVLRCGSLLLNVIFSFSSVRCIRWPGSALIRVSCRCVIDVMLLHCECCTRIIRTRITGWSVSFHLL